MPLSNEDLARRRAQRCAKQDYKNGETLDATRYNALPQSAWAEWYRNEYKRLRSKTMNKFASSPTRDGLQKLLNEYYYSTTYRIDDDLQVHNAKGKFDKVLILLEKDRYVAYN